MIVSCPHCGKSVVVNGLGRKPLNIPLKIVCDALQEHRSVKSAANELRCSEAYIFKVLKANELKLKDIINWGIGASKSYNLNVCRPSGQFHARSREIRSFDIG